MSEVRVVRYPRLYETLGEARERRKFEARYGRMYAREARCACPPDPPSLRWTPLTSNPYCPRCGLRRA